VFGIFINDDESLIDDQLLIPADAVEVVDNVNFGFLTAVSKPDNEMPSPGSPITRPPDFGASPIMFKLRKYLSSTRGRTTGGGSVVQFEINSQIGYLGGYADQRASCTGAAHHALKDRDEFQEMTSPLWTAGLSSQIAHQSMEACRDQATCVSTASIS
jgi:hypothetical protein